MNTCPAASSKLGNMLVIADASVPMIGSGVGRTTILSSGGEVAVVPTTVLPPVVPGSSSEVVPCKAGEGVHCPSWRSSTTCLIHNLRDC